MEELMSDDVHQERVIVKVENVNDMKKQLLEHDCEYHSARTQKETYLKQPEKEVLKITKDKDKTLLVRLHENDGKLDVVRTKPISEKEQKELKEHYGVRTTITNTHHTFLHENTRITLTENEKGVFLTFQAEHVRDEIYKELGIKNPTIIQTSFAFL